MHRIGTEVGRWFAVCVLVMLGPAAAQAEDGIQFANLSVEDGLSQTSVQAIVQDRRGFMWLGTQEGLNRFDGRSFLQYFNDGGDRSLTHNWIWTLHQDPRGRIWIGTDGGGLNRFDPDTGRFHHFTHREDDPASIAGNVVRSVLTDDQGYLWVGSDGGGISRIDPQSDVVVRLPDLPAGQNLPNRRVRVLHQHRDGQIWVATDGGGIFRLEPESGSVEQLHLADGIAAIRVRSLATQGSRLWIGTYENGLIELDTRSGAVRRFRHRAADPASLSGNSVRALFVADDGTLWVGTDGQGLNRFVADRGTFVRYQHDPMDPTSLADDHVVEIYQDRGGVIWVGTYRGTSRWNPHIGTFRTVARHGDAPEQLSDNYVTSLAESDDGAIWVGTYGGGLNRWGSDRAGFEHFTHDPQDPGSLSDDRVFALEADADALWIGTRGGALNRLDLGTGKMRHFAHDPERPGSLSADGITSLLRDSRGTLWVGTFVAGLNRLVDAASGRFSHFRHDPGDPQSLCSDRVLALTEGADGGIWVGTFGGGLCHLDPASGRFTRYRHDPADPASLSSDRAWSVHEDAAGNLWVGTQDAGLNVWRAAARRSGRVAFERYGADHGLGGVAVYATESDAAGNVWFSTNRGLVRIDAVSGELRRFDVNRGLQSNEFNHGAHGRTRRGELMFGGIAGFNIFRPETIRVNRHPPQIALTEVIRLNTPLPYPAWSDGDLTFSHRDALISFQFAALDFTAPERNVFRHRLVGFDSEWIEDGDVRRATYTNLGAGDYVLEVTAANSDGVWAEQPLQVPFRVRPAPWASTWAIAGYAALALLALALLYRSQTRRIAIANQIQQTNQALRAEMSRREQQQRDLDSARERARHYLNVVEVMIVSLDHDGCIRLINPKGLRVLDYEESELLGRNFYDTLVPIEQRDAVRAEFAGVQDHAYTESPVITRTGEQRLIAWHVVALPEDTDNSGGLLVSGMDLTQERSLERQIHEAQRLEALGTLARGIAHDFNNILAAILGFAEMVRGRIAPDSEAQRYLDDLDLSVDRARGLIKSILVFGRQSRAEPVPTRLQNLVTEAQQLLTPTVPAGIEVAVHCDDTAPAVLADPNELHQLIMNLATNAVQAMGTRGGTLTMELTSRMVSIAEARARSGLGPGRYVALSVSDTGPGMDETTRARMFEPFFTTKEPGRGTGLGLAVVHGLVNRMGGDIRVDSAPGQGTRILVLLPACDTPAGGAADRLDTPDTAPGGQETLLLVDDEPMLLDLGAAMLEPLGYRVLAAANGPEALQTAERAGGIDLLVTDQNMPGMSGMALAREMRARFGALPVVLMSGAHDPDVRDPLITRRLEKPFRHRDLAQAVRSALDAGAREPRQS